MSHHKIKSIKVSKAVQMNIKMLDLLDKFNKNLASSVQVRWIVRLPVVSL